MVIAYSSVLRARFYLKYRSIMVQFLGSIIEPCSGKKKIKQLEKGDRTSA
jgi:hypothetical protein